MTLINSKFKLLKNTLLHKHVLDVSYCKDLTFSPLEAEAHVPRSLGACDDKNNMLHKNEITLEPINI